VSAPLSFVISVTSVAAALWSTTYAAATAIAIGRWRARVAREPPRDGASRAPRRVVLIRPLAGSEEGLEARLAQAGGADEVIFAVGSSDDGAMGAAIRAVEALRGRGVAARIVVTRAGGPNHKAAQLAIAVAAAGDDDDRILAVADSDVELEATTIARLVVPLRGAIVATWAPPVEAREARTRGDAASRAVLDASLHAFSLLAGIDRNGFVGKLFAIREGALRRVGGFGALRDHLGEDMELGRRLRAAGLGFAPVAVLARSVAQGRTLPAVVDRYRRWLLVIRGQRAALLLSYPLLLAAAPGFLAASTLGIARGDVIVSLAGLLGLAARAAVAIAARHAAGRSAPLLATLRDALIADGVLLVALALALRSRAVVWRGVPLTVTADGALRARATGERERAGEDSLRGAREERRVVLEEELEAGALARRARERGIDPAEAGRDPLALRVEPARDVAGGGLGRAEGDEQVRPLPVAKDVAERDRHHLGAAGHARDLRGPREDLERREGRALASLGEHPERAAGSIEKVGRVADGASAIGRIGEVHPEGSDASEEREPPQVRRVHEGVPLGAEHALGEPQHDQRVPPGAVVDDEEQRAVDEARADRVQLRPRDDDAAEGAHDPRARVPREPRREPRAPGRRDHDEVLR